MFHWCTDEVEPHDRFDFWREVRSKGLFGVTAELERERRADFFGEFSLRQLGGAGLVELKASHYTVERSTADIARGDLLPGVQRRLWHGARRFPGPAVGNGLGRRGPKSRATPAIWAKTKGF